MSWRRALLAAAAIGGLAAVAGAQLEGQTVKGFRLPEYDADGKLKQFSLGYDHSLSKRSGVYAALTSKKLSDFGFEDETANTFAVGLRHAF